MRKGEGYRRNMIGGQIEEFTPENLVACFDESVRDRVRGLFEMPGTRAVVMYRVLQMDSPLLGQTQAMAAGPGRTYSVEQAIAGRLGDVPSRFAYPVAIAFVDES